MIAKISATENLGGALGYNFKKVEKGEASILLTAELYQSKEGRYTMEDVLAEYGGIDTEELPYQENGVPLFAQSAPGRETLR